MKEERRREERTRSRRRLSVCGLDSIDCIPMTLAERERRVKRGKVETFEPQARVWVLRPCRDSNDGADEPLLLQGENCRLYRRHSSRNRMRNA